MTVQTAPRLFDPAGYGLAVRSLAFVHGELLTGSASADTIAVEDPAYAIPIAKVADGGPDDVDRAVSDASAAQRGVWARTTPVERGRLLAACAAELRRRADELSTLESIDTGKPVSQARSDVETAAKYFDYYAGVADKLGGETIPTDSDTLVYTLREPYGVIAHITPWNSPLSQMARGVAPSLAGGNTVVVKPSEVTPLSTLVAAQVLLDAGLPPGVCNVVVGRGTTAGAALVAHPLVAHVTFTGSVRTGQHVMASAAQRVVGCNLELGGKSPTIVLPDADLQAAAMAGAAASIRNAGQSCFATTRMVVHESIHDEFVERCAARMSSLTVGRGVDDPDLGPLSSRTQYERVRGYVEKAVADGAEVAAGGAGPGAALPDELRNGHFFSPTLLVGVENSMQIAQEEVFGPVQVVIPFGTEDEAVAIANDSVYGLAAGIFTRSLSAAHRIARRLEAGQVQVNRYPAGGVETPFGGYKQSGIGREKGLEALRHYTQLKTVIVALDGEPVIPAIPTE
jgi:aldehyde dehydrogenase (NAD+)